MKVLGRGGVVFVCLLGSLCTGTHAEEPYEEIRLFLSGGKTAETLLRVPEIELMGLGDGDITLLSRPSVTDALIAEGWAVEVIHSDLEAFYASRYSAAEGHGPWFNYDETVEELNLLHEEYPSITTEPVSIGLSHEERDIWMIKISDNPDLDENEPEVLFDGLHHAREIMSLELALYYARYLCENYRVDSLASHLVDEREIYFVPIVNPDGLVYNELIRPEGGGMWRKNRSENAGGCFGVDINRNYPFQWGRIGSSGNPCEDTYRGTDPASEPETQAMIDLINERRFVTHNSLHSVLGAILMPWCYTSTPTIDDDTFRELSRMMASRSGYAFGQCPEVLYLVSGGFIDWAYGEQTTKPRIFSFTTEVGGSGFWPQFSEREGLLQENLHSMLYLSEVAGPILELSELVTEVADGATEPEPGDVVDMTFSIQNTGLVADAIDIRLKLKCDDPYIDLQKASETIDHLPVGGAYTNDEIPFRFLVDEGALVGRRAPFTLEVRSPGARTIEYPYMLRIGSASAIHANDFESESDEWIHDESHTALTGAFVRVDPRATLYQPEFDATPGDGTHAWITGQNTSDADGDVDDGIAATRSPDFDLSGYTEVMLSVSYFHGQREGGDDPSGDWFSFDVSPDGGSSWVNLVWIGDQFSSPEWRELVVELGDFISLTDQVRFRVQVSDAPGNGDLIEGGIDRFHLYDLDLPNGRPDVPELASPIDPPDGVSAWPQLTVRNATDPENDPLTYGFRIFSDSDLTTLVASADEIREGSEATSWTPASPLDDGTYYWRAFAADPQQRGLYSETAQFTVTDSAAVYWSERAPVLLAGPNPVVESLRIRYIVPPSLTSRLTLYDAEGRVVRSFDVCGSCSGWREIDWDGKNDAGRKVASGSYWLRLWTPRETRTLQVIRID